MQNVLEAQETSLRPAVEGATLTATGADQVPDTSLRAYPEASIAIQKPVVGQDSPTRSWCASMICGLDQVEPLKVIALPLPSTAVHEVGVGQDSAVVLPPGARVVGEDTVWTGPEK